MSGELKSCPFCGGDARKDFKTGRSGRTPFTQCTWFRGAVKCTSCGSSTEIKTNPDAAIRAWNKRAKEPKSLEASHD